MTRKLMVGVITSAIFLIGCGGSFGKMVGTVEDVRILAANVQKVEGDNKVAGAVMGALLADASGAVIGSAMGDNKKVTIATEVLECALIVQATDGTVIRFNSVNRVKKNQMALFQKGDKVNLHKSFGDYYLTGYDTHGDLVPK